MAGGDSERRFSIRITLLCEAGVSGGSQLLALSSIAWCRFRRLLIATFVYLVPRISLALPSNH
jgi:hypothetical protein